MILGQFNGLASLADNAACIARISDIEVRRRDKNHICSATSLIRVVLSRHIVGVLASNALQLLAPVRGQKQLVNADKHINQALLVILSAEVLIVLQLIDKVVATIFGNFRATVSIKDSKE